MPWMPEDYDDAFWFAVTPVTSPVIAVYSASAWATDDWRYGKPDWQANIRNSLLWTGIAATAFGWNYFMSPHNATFLSGFDAMKNAVHIFSGTSAAVPAALTAVAVGSAVGWAATAEHHGAVTPGVASGIGMPMTPELYSTGTADNPAGWDFQTWWDNL